MKRIVAAMAIIFAFGAAWWLVSDTGEQRMRRVMIERILERHPDAQVKTSILKTVGILREYQGRGLSRSIAWNLTYEYHMRLIRRGYENFIHALMKEDNASRAMSDRFAKKIREYRLYEAALTGPWPGRDRPRVPSTLTFSISRPLTERIALRRWSRRSR